MVVANFDGSERPFSGWSSIVRLATTTTRHARRATCSFISGILVSSVSEVMDISYTSWINQFGERKGDAAGKSQGDLMCS